MGLACRYFVGLVLLWSLRIALGQGDFHRISFSVLQHEYDCGDYGMQLLVFPSQGRTVRFKVVDEFGTPFEVTNCSICLHWVTSGEQGAMIFSAGYNGCHVQKKDGRNHLQVRVEELLSARAVAATYDVNMTCPKPTERDLTPEETMRYVPQPQPGLVRPVPQPQPGLVRPVPQPQPGLVRPVPQPQPGLVRPVPQPQPGLVRPVPQPQPGLVRPVPQPQPGLVRPVPQPQPGLVRPVPQPQPGLVRPVPQPQPGLVRPVPQPQPGLVRPVPQPQPGLVRPVPQPQPGLVRPVPQPQPGLVRPVPQPQPGLVRPVPQPQPGLVRPVPQPQPGLVRPVPQPQPGLVRPVPQPQPGLVRPVPQPQPGLVRPVPQPQPGLVRPVPQPQPGLVRPVPQPQPGLVRPVPQPQPGLVRPVPQPQPGLVRPVPQPQPGLVRPVPQPQPGLVRPVPQPQPGLVRPVPQPQPGLVRPVPQPQPGLVRPVPQPQPGLVRPVPQPQPGLVRPVPQPQPGLVRPVPQPQPGLVRPVPQPQPGLVRPVPQPQPGLVRPVPQPQPGLVRPVPQPQPGLVRPVPQPQPGLVRPVPQPQPGLVRPVPQPQPGLVRPVPQPQPGLVRPVPQPQPGLVRPVPQIYPPPSNIGAHLTEEQCRVVAGKMPCADAPGQAACFQAGCCYDETDLTTPCYFGNTVTVQCLLDGHFVLVVSRDMSDHPIILESVRLAYAQAGCDPIRMTEAFVIFRFPLMQCGTTVQVIHDKLIYENQLISGIDIRTGPDGSITRDSTFILHARCIYNASDFLPVQVEVFLPPTPAPVTQAGPLRLELRIATDPSYRSYLSERDYPVVKVLRDPVYMEVRILHRTDPSLVLVLHQCWATPSANPLQQPQWPILVDGCPFLGDNYRTQLVPVGPASSELPFPTHHQRFVLSTFAFVDSASQVALEGEVYIYCSASACYPSRLEPCRTLCPSGAATRGRRFLDINNGTGEPQDLVSSPGPVIFQESPEPWREHVYENKDPVSRLDLTLVLLAMLSLVAVASLVTVTLLHRRSSWMTRSQIFHGR
ncbi:unnamed protein product [Lepidochelys olivacea]